MSRPSCLLLAAVLAPLEHCAARAGERRLRLRIRAAQATEGQTGADSPWHMGTMQIGDARDSDRGPS
eukprot:12932397-Heterocapsa_arctica.AAC.1